MKQNGVIKLKLMGGGGAGRSVFIDCCEHACLRSSLSSRMMELVALSPREST